MSNTDLIARLKAFRGMWMGDGIAPSIERQALIDALAAQAATIAEQAAQIEALRAVIREARQALEAANVADNGPIRDTIWMPGRPETLFDFLDAAMQSGKAAEPDATKCRKCNGNMRPGTYLEQTFSGVPDFPGDTHAVTVSPSGPGRLAECLKCDACGHSVTAGKAVTP